MSIPVESMMDSGDETVELLAKIAAESETAYEQMQIEGDHFYCSVFILLL